MKKFYFVGYFGARVEKQHLADVKNDPDVVLITENLNVLIRKNRVLKKLFFLCHEWKRISLKEPLLAKFWNAFYTISSIEFEKENDNYVVFFDSAISVYYSEYFFKELKKKNIKVILYIYDQMTQYYSDRVMRMAQYADAVICTIKEDCDLYGFKYYPLIYSVNDYDFKKKLETQSDIYFLGTNGGRIKDLHSIYEYLSKYNIICDFNIVGVDDSEKKYKDKINYNKSFSVEEHLAHVVSTNCILEIMHEGMNAVTARYPEALKMNKKLLTNNKNVVNEKYYNPDYIRVFDKVEDIDVNWILERKDIEYGYKNDFSARALIDYIKTIV